MLSQERADKGRSMNIVLITVGSLAAVVLAGKGALYYADEAFRWFAERNGF